MDVIESWHVGTKIGPPQRCPARHHLLLLIRKPVPLRPHRLTSSVDMMV